MYLGWTKSSLTQKVSLSVYSIDPVYIKISPYKLSGTSSQLTNQISSENKETMLTGDFNINYQKADDNGELKSIFTLFQLK